MFERHLDVGGAVVFWNLAEWTNREQLMNHWTPLGLERLVPEPRPAPAALRSALEEVLGGPRVLVRPLASRDGFVVVRENRGLNANQYQTDLTARVVLGEPPSLSFEPWDDRSPRVRMAYTSQLGRLSAGQMSAALVEVVESLGGTRLRPNGAIYWLPGNRVAEWGEIAHSVESSADGTASAIHMLRHPLDPDAVRAVRDAIVADVQSEAARIKEEILSGELGGRALETRKMQATSLRQKVLLYEDLLSVGLKGLHRAIDEADQAAATAAIMLAAPASPRSDPVLALG